MRKPITPFAHGLIDYTTNATLTAAPKLMRLDRRAATVCYALAGGYTALSMLTDYPLAAKRVVPFKAHGLTEAIVGAALPAVPFAFGFASERRARNLLFGLTTLTAVVSVLTDWDKKSERVARRRHRRRPTLTAARSLGRGHPTIV
jgi:hypothetical protein